MHFLYGLIGMGLAFVLIKYRAQVVDMIGRFEWAEKYLGSTYNAVVLSGTLFFFLSFLIFIGEEDLLLGWMAGKIS